jgi:hypothetical protein
MLTEIKAITPISSPALLRSLGLIISEPKIRSLLLTSEEITNNNEVNIDHKVSPLRATLIEIKRKTHYIFGIV